MKSSWKRSAMLVATLVGAGLATRESNACTMPMDPPPGDPPLKITVEKHGFNRETKTHDFWICLDVGLFDPPDPVNPSTCVAGINCLLPPLPPECTFNVADAMVMKDGVEMPGFPFEPDPNVVIPGPGTSFGFSAVVPPFDLPVPDPSRYKLCFLVQLGGIGGPATIPIVVAAGALDIPGHELMPFEGYQKEIVLKWVPLPPAAWMGLSLLSGAAGFNKIRRLVKPLSRFG